MSPSGPEDSLYAALEQAAKAPVLLVVTDFDGALAEFCLEPGDAAPAPGGMAALRGLAALPGTHVAIASGRDLHTLRHLTGIGSAERIVLVGSHGAECTRAEVVPRGRLDADQKVLLDALTEEVAGLIERHPGARLERKRAAVAVHTRGLARAVAEAALEEASALGQHRRDVRVLRGKSVVELSVSHADKGSAVTALGRLLHVDATVYAGDDVTDEDAFRVLDPGAGDVTVKVGPGETTAAYRVGSVNDLVATLALLWQLRRQEQGEVV